MFASILFLTVTTVMASPLTKFSSEAQALCNDWLGGTKAQVVAEFAWAEQEVLVKLGRLPTVRVSSEKLPDDRTRIQVKARNAWGFTIGDLKATVIDTGYLKIERIKVSGLHQNRAISKLLFAHVLSRYPKIQIVESILTLDNDDVIREAIAGGSTCKEAIRLTYAVKMRVRFGFTRLLNEPTCLDYDPTVVILSRK